MNATLSTLYAPGDKPRLIEAVQKRTSCRSFAGGPSIAEAAALNYAVARYGLPGTRAAFFPVEAGFFTGTLLAARRITGCEMAAALIVRDAPHARLHAGILGESLVLEATHLGLGTCWVSGSYRHGTAPVELAAGESVLCVIAIGRPQQPLAAPKTRHRKPPEHFCRGNFRAWPPMLLTAAMLVQQAPSAMNMQPWTLFVGERGEFVLDTVDRAELDAGIALCHAELALDVPHSWHYGTKRGEPTAWAMAK